MTDSRFALIEFHGDQLLTIFDGQTVRVAMKPLVERLGIAWPRQYQKLKDDPVLSEGVTLTVIPSERGAQETVTLPIDLMQGWLFKLNPERVAPEARERVIAYQRECYQVLNDYWVKGRAVNPRHAGAKGNAAPLTTAELLKLVERIKEEWQPEIRAMLYALLDQMCGRMNLPLPAIEAFGQPDQRHLAIARAFFEGIAQLLAAGVMVNRHRRSELLAVSLPEIERLFAAHDIAWIGGTDLHSALREHPAFIKRAKVNCRDGVFRACWVFDAAKLARQEPSSI
ncbi:MULTISPECIES: phage antirepressor N-terminal domain-containing protein [unclassified Novosphingobium]|uniref:phage antirepressor N-terminal domain-containing protein n=1 Tax=unclassified Novosphingobium TaxID=2644732 RepID=UPI000D31493E|nr:MULTISPECIES: phage antirepressor N-terminal domain-containing protein [unclassified Novosphingobium]PTR05479.1 P22-like antirepressor protein [Novosphingobium sp. GV055]PUA94037.1 P22-like antirepressor protein [Novosphingobium sp. GV061]PUB11624.1 P22-like antirepressor protein [Novosphingobium sp. GV079]PUB37098.1 P22-like antirepressor protein [Novosphingobium sp. GV027]